MGYASGLTRATGQAAAAPARGTQARTPCPAPCGNQALLRRLQAKLKVGAVNDPLEHEADRVADQVMRMPAPGAAMSSAPPQVSRKCDKCEEEKKLQKKEAGPQTAIGEAPASVHEVLRAPGQPLDAQTRAYFEPRFGRDFSSVRVHSGPVAAQSARDVNAHAFTVGHNIAFNSGQFAPGSQEGRRLLAHELTHVVQQGGVNRAVGWASRSGAADGAKVHVPKAGVSARPEGVSVARSAQIIQRQPIPPTSKTTRAEEVHLSLTSPGEIAAALNPPTLSLYNFAIDQATLKQKHIAALRAIAFLNKQSPAGKFRIAVNGHADPTGEHIVEGEDVVNDPLSKNRAVAVQKALGAPSDIFWYGDRRPVTTNDTVEGRSRNRRVDISISGGKGKTDHCEGPLCDLPCEGPKLLLCACVLAFEACLFCLLNPELCFCQLFPTLCKPDDPKKKGRRACPLSFNVDFPKGKKVDPATAGDDLRIPFNMRATFKQEAPKANSSYCDCNCGEYRQFVRGYFKRDMEKGVKGPLKTVDHFLSASTKLMEAQEQEDGVPLPIMRGRVRVRQGPYGHRYVTDEARKILKAAATPLLAENDQYDSFVNPNREDGCTYKGYDLPGIEAHPNEEVHFHLWFRGGPVDACNGNAEKGEWKEWEITCDRVPPRPPNLRHPLIERPFIVRSGLPKDPKIGQEITLEIAFPGQPEGCYGKIPVMIIDVSDFEVTIMTSNSEPVQIAPEACPDIWVEPYQIRPIYRTKIK